MASFTDNLQYLTQFTPYIQQQPVETMAKVGMAKQEQYNQGLQKIQSSIDTIGGLDIAKDSDRAYLQNKINTLGNNLKFVAAGDFSDFQLVNSVNGMTSNLVKDPNVVNAVSSTSLLRKEQKRKEKAIEEGKSSPENEWIFDTQTSQYLNDSTIGQKYNTRYIDYIDVNKKLYDIAKEVGIDETTVQQLYQTDANGKILVDGNGVPKWNPIMAEKHLKGKDAGKILTAFKTALTPADYRQLSITGRYKGNNVTPGELASQVSSIYDSNIENTEGKLQSVELELYKQNQKNTKDVELIASLNKQKDFFTQEKETLVTSKEKDLALAYENPDQVKASLYTNNYLSKMSSSLSSLTEDTKYSVSPLFTITMEQNRFNRELQRDKISDYHWSVEQKQKEADSLYAREKDQLELFLKYGIGTPPAGYKGSKGVKEAINTENGEFAIVNAVKDDYEQGTFELNQKNAALTLQFFKEVNPKVKGETEEAYESRLKRAMSSYAKANKESSNPDSGDVNTFTARFAAKQLQEWAVNPSSIPYEFRDLVESQFKLTKELNLQKNRIEKTTNDARRIAQEQGVDVPSEKQIKDNIKGTTVVVKGKTIALDRQDVLDLVDLRPGSFEGRMVVSKAEEKKTQRAKERLALKYGDAYKDIENQVYNMNSSPMYTVIGGLLGTNAQMHPAVQKAGDFIYSTNYQNIAKIEAKLYADKGVMKQPISFPIQRGTENKDDVNARLATVISKYSGNLNEQEGFNTKEVIAAAISDKAGAVKLTVSPGISTRQPVSYSMTVIGENGEERKLKIDEDDFTYLSKQPAFVSQEEPLVVQQLKTYGTTGLDGTNNPKAAWFANNDFVNLKGSGYNVTANLVEDKNNPELVYFRMFVHQKDGSVIPLTYDTPISKTNTDGTYNQALDRLPEAIYPATISQLLNAKK
jgi:hypothetical protein